MEIKTKELPKNYYKERLIEVTTDFNKIKINYENTLDKLMYSKQELDHVWSLLKEQQEYITILEDKLKERE